MSKQKCSQQSCLSFMFFVPQNSPQRNQSVASGYRRNCKPFFFFILPNVNGHDHPVGSVKLDVVVKQSALCFGVSPGKTILEDSVSFIRVTW